MAKHARFYIRIRTTRGSLPHVVIIISAYCITISLSSACAYKPGFTVFRLFTFSDDIGGFQNIMYKSLDSNNIIINWTLADGMACLIMKNYITNIVISIGDHTDINNCSSSKWSYNETLHNRDSNNITITISNNTVLTDDLCVMVQYTINSRDVPFYYVMKSAIKGLQPG